MNTLQLFRLLHDEPDIETVFAITQIDPPAELTTDELFALFDSKPKYGLGMSLAIFAEEPTLTHLINIRRELDTCAQATPYWISSLTALEAKRSE